MHRLILALAFSFSLAFAVPSAGHAAPLEQACTASAVRQHDMAGRYVNASMAIDVYPCGGSFLVWQNSYGRHSASYLTFMRVTSGGVAARGYEPDPVYGGFMDSASVLAIKPAEPGFVEILTFDASLNVIGVYRLQKIGPAI